MAVAVAVKAMDAGFVQRRKAFVPQVRYSAAHTHPSGALDRSSCNSIVEILSPEVTDIPVLSSERTSD